MAQIKLNISNFSGHTYYSLRQDDKNKSNDIIEFSPVHFFNGYSQYVNGKMI